MNKSKVLSTFGLAYKASKMVTGEEMCLDRIKKRKALLVFLAKDAGPNTTKRITDKASFYNVKLNTEFTSDELSNSTGKINRKALAITDANFVLLIEKALNE
ncbi:MAG: ribosomal L7Ae/L30e/S12e/Gadd45 family protein [Firmicutes bacterium]|nr:ribosomal L7Ae/L30e/S12e/Gadd45 family protein [Bacillota bacterium]